MVSANVKRQKFAAKVYRLRRRLDTSWFAEFPRRRPAIALWLLVLGFLAVQLQVWNGPPKGPEFVLTPRDRCVEIMAKEAVARSLSVIGHQVRVSSVMVGPTQPFASAQYTMGSARIDFSLSEQFTADGILHTAAHETVHAIFDTARLNPYSSSPAWESRLLVEEVTASVLGAHIAGKVRTVQGADGAALTRALVAEYRSLCTWSDSGMRRLVWRYATRVGVDKINYEAAHSIAIHYGPPELVDAIDQICRENPDPWVAAHVIAERHIEPIEEPGLPAPQTSTAASGGGG